MWKNLFHFTQREKSGLIVLIVLIAAFFGGKFLLIKPHNEWPEVLKNLKENELKDSIFSDNSPNPSETKRTYFNQHQKKFNVNTFKRKATASVEKKTYFNNQTKTAFFQKDSIKKYQPIEKISQGSQIDINKVDTASLIRIPGIGQSYASRILKYRQLLGGYYSVEQLKEVYGMYEELYDKIIPFLSLSTDSVIRIPINRASLDRLKAHPYINFYQAKAIVELRNKKGKIERIEELSLLEEFTTENLEKIKNYLSFN